MMDARFTTSSKLPALLACLARAFAALGIPADILVDNMKQAVDQHDAATGTVRWNKGFLDFAEHHGFLPVACPPYWPRVKGKVERGIGYVKRSFLEGRRFSDLADLNRQLEHWLDTVANVRVHGTTGERPVDRHAEERASLAITRADLFILDEVGYLPLASADATFLFEAVSNRYEARKPILLTSNKSYGQWGEIFPDPVLATALLDRLLHHATTINIRGESFRLRHRRQGGLPPAA